jgi:hypothetical protein
MLRLTRSGTARHVKGMKGFRPRPVLVGVAALLAAYSELVESASQEESAQPTKYSYSSSCSSRDSSY